ncbi:MAG: CPBP family intramembrane glutamic endopeptidase [Bacteroidota bacterium]
MGNSYFSSRHPFVQLVFAALIILVTFLAVTLLTLIPGLFIFRVPLSDWASALDVSNPANVPFLKYLQITQVLALFILPPMIIGWIDCRNPFKFLQIDRIPGSRLTLLSIAILILIVPLITFLGWLNESMQLPRFLGWLEDWMLRSEAQMGDLTKAFLEVNNFGGYLINVLMVVFLAAFGEEFFFRGIVQKLLHRWIRNPHWAIIVAAIIFSAFHQQYYGFLPRFVLGLLFGYLFYWSGNLWYAIIPHFINNLIPVTLSYAAPAMFASGELEPVITGQNDWIWIVPATLAAIGAVYYFYRKARVVTPRSDE